MSEQALKEFENVFLVQEDLHETQKINWKKTVFRKKHPAKFTFIYITK